MNAGEFVIRRAGPADEESVLDVCAQALHWAGDGGDAVFFHWKHRENPFGPSPIWVAEDDVEGHREIVGVRTMMRWELRRPPDGVVLRMGRAVDTATLPSHQGRGIFSRLTMAAVEELCREGQHAIFNTPNGKSGPGYLKMGWSSLGKAPVRVRPSGVGGLLAMARGRTAAERWGLPVDVGLAPSEAFADSERLQNLLNLVPAPDRWHTPVTVDYLRWRTSFEPLRCRVALLGSELEDGILVFRVRQRGAVRQLSLLHVVRPARAPALRPAIGRLMNATGCDLAMATGHEVGWREALVPLPRIGPELVWRVLSDQTVPTMDDLSLPLGALELF